jgi:hypothetical protein
VATYIASQTKIGYKTSGDAYTLVGQVTSFSGPSWQVASIETTTLDDTAKQYRPGITDSGEMSFELNFDPSNTAQTAVKGFIESPQVVSWQVTFPTTPDATTFTFDGFPTAFEVSGGGPEELITASLTIKITGSVAVDTVEGA